MKAKPTQMKNAFLWSDAYLIIAEENFEEVFKSLYEKEFVDHLFLAHEARVFKKDFISAIAGAQDDMPKCDWLFSTVKLRNIFMEYIDFDNYKEIIDQYL